MCVPQGEIKMNFKNNQLVTVVVVPRESFNMFLKKTRELPMREIAGFVTQKAKWLLIWMMM